MKPHDSAPCAAVDHYSWHYSVLWCPHRQAFIVSKTKYAETGHYDDFADYARQEIELGPFDGWQGALDYLILWIGEHSAEWQAHVQPAGPPGSPG